MEACEANCASLMPGRRSSATDCNNPVGGYASYVFPAALC